MHSPRAWSSARQAWSKPTHYERGAIKSGGQHDPSQRHAEPVAPAKKQIAAQQQEAHSQQERQSEQQRAVHQRKVRVDETIKHPAITVARIEANPRLPHGRLARDDERYRLHLRLQLLIAWV